jgi:hypothetical protein
MRKVRMATKVVNSSEEEAGKLEDRGSTRNAAVAAGGGDHRPGTHRPFRFVFGKKCNELFLEEIQQGKTHFVKKS